METEVHMKWAEGESLSGGADIARTSHIGSVTPFIKSYVNLYEQIQPDLTCKTPQTHHSAKCFTKHNDYVYTVTLLGNVKNSPGQPCANLYVRKEIG